MTLSEIEIILTEGNAFHEEMLFRHVDLKTSVLNAPWTHRNDKRPWKITDFLPEYLKKKVAQVTEEEQVKRILARGEAVAERCKQLRKGD